MKKSLLKPLEIVIFALKIINFGYEKVPLWITLTTKAKKVLTILIENLISFQILFIFFEKSSDLVALCMFLYTKFWVTFTSQK